MPCGDLAPGWSQDWPRRWCVTKGARVSRHVGAPGLPRDKPADARGYPPSSRKSCGGQHGRSTSAASIGLIISTPYLPESTANVRYQHAPLRSIRTGQTKYSVITGTIR
ncbi:MAG: hypothetical protein QOH09_1636 [Pseudonocardiales bacterium]|jgi:hypothetical protein|nr:hypothetical protein [Pseudonocardiales bacterium]